MKASKARLQEAVDSLLETLPPVWDRIRSNLRAAATEQFGITLEQFHVLRHIRRGYRSVAELAEKKGISRSAISQAVEALAVKGLVTRTQEIGDRRCVRLEITALASEALDANFEKNRIWMKGTMAALDQEELGIVLAATEILRTTFAPEET